MIHLNSWGSNHISATAEAGVIKFGVRAGRVKSSPITITIIVIVIIIIIIRIVHEVHNKKANQHGMTIKSYTTTLKHNKRKMRILKTIRTDSRNTHIYIITI